MKTFYMMRHGQTLFNVRKKVQGSCDSPLTELGIKQAQVASEVLKGIEFDHYYCSTSERASDTLEIVIGHDTPYTRLKGLKERDFGTFEGESEDLNPRWENGYDAVFPHYGGETSDEVKERVRKTCIEIMEKDNHTNVLAVSHAGASYHFLRNWVEHETFSRIFEEGGFPNCCIVKYIYKDGEFNFEEVIRPDFSHL